MLSLCRSVGTRSLPRFLDLSIPLSVLVEWNIFESLSNRWIVSSVICAILDTQQYRESAVTGAADSLPGRFGRLCRYLMSQALTRTLGKLDDRWTGQYCSIFFAQCTAVADVPQSG